MNDGKASRGDRPRANKETLEVARLFDAMADSYDEPQPWYDHLYETLHAILLKHLAPPDDGLRRRSLDAGCGTGLQTSLLEELGYESHGVDISSGLLARARLRLKGSTLTVGDLQDLPFPNKYFDVISCCGSTLSFISDPARAIREMSRVLRSGGKLLLECEHKWTLDIGWSLFSALTFNSLGYDISLTEIVRQLWRPPSEGFLIEYPFPTSSGLVDHMKLRVFTVSELDEMLGQAGLVRRRTWGIHMLTNLIPSTILHGDALSYPVGLLFRQLCKFDRVLQSSRLAHILANSIVILAEHGPTYSPPVRSGESSPIHAGPAR